jgi:hypothetical protein
MAAVWHMTLTFALAVWAAWLYAGICETVAGPTDNDDE